MFPRCLIVIASLLFVACGSSSGENEKSNQASATQNETISPDTNKLSDSLKPAVDNNSSKWEYANILSDTIFFKNGNHFKTNLYELKYIGQIPSGDKVPFLIFSGRDCDECDAGISIYIHSPGNGILNVDYGANGYLYPGVQKDYETGSVLYTARAFYGQILDNIEGVIWYQQNLMDDGKMKQHTFLVQMDHGKLKDTSYAGHASIKKTITLMEKGLCSEIQGKTYLSEP